ncbi:undecaprenyl diphosphate synthase [Eubacterium ruminantium]|nr:undecaprenyl diphosphate synthase [Eubacterium ruminantium]
MERIIDGEKLNVPEHIAVIMDGNGRWAKKRLMPRNFGHKAGADALEQACEDADHLGIKYFTVYAFSTENWKRSVEEVAGIMNLFRRYLENSIAKSNKNNMRVRIIGEKSALAPDIIKAINNLEEATKNNTGLQFTVAINYGGRDEIRRAMVKVANEIKDGTLEPKDITEELISRHLDTREIPDPDLLIRTSGEERISNFLPWQLAYSEFYFTDTLWPDFCRDTFIDAIRHYTKRDRRFGGVK